MGIFEHFPYTNFHDLNLDRIIQLVSKVEKEVKRIIGIPISTNEDNDAVAFGKEATTPNLVDSAWDIKAPNVQVGKCKFLLDSDSTDPSVEFEKGLEFSDTATGVAGRVIMTYSHSTALNKWVANQIEFMHKGYDPVTGERTGFNDYYKLPPLPINNAQNETYLIWTSKAIPEPPTTDGTYTLQVVVADGTPTFSWV